MTLYQRLRYASSHPLFPKAWTYTAIILLMIFLFPVLKKRWKGKRRGILFCVVWTVYLLGALWFTFLSRSPMARRRARWAFFQTYRVAYRLLFRSGRSISSLLRRLPGTVEELYLNVLLFVPLGYLLPQTAMRKIKMRQSSGSTIVRMLFTFFVSSLCIEVVQYLTRMGTFDVNDLVNNTLGGLLGLAIYGIERRLGWL